MSTTRPVCAQEFRKIKGSRGGHLLSTGARCAMRSEKQQSETGTGRGNGAAPPTGPSSPFDDMDALRKANKAAFEGEKEGAVVVLLGRPKKEIYARFHRDDDYYLSAYVWAETDDSRVMYFVTNNLWDLEDLQGGLRAVTLAPWLGSDGSVGLWPMPASSNAGSWYD